MDLKIFEQILPQRQELTNKLTDLTEKINHFKSVSLEQIIKFNTKTTFLSVKDKACYKLKYKPVDFSFCKVHDLFVSNKHKNDFIVEPMHSLSGELDDLCFYSYTPTDFQVFLDTNKHNKYTFLPLTIYGINNPNGYRHDTLLVFNNQSKTFYWINNNNYKDTLQYGHNMIKDAVDVLFTNFSVVMKLGYNYEATSSWVIELSKQLYPSLGDLDFILSTAWCYLTLKLIDNYESPTAFYSVLYELNPTIKFHLLYQLALYLINSHYQSQISENMNINLSENKSLSTNSKFPELKIEYPTNLSSEDIPTPKVEYNLVIDQSTEQSTEQYMDQETGLETKTVKQSTEQSADQSTEQSTEQESELDSQKKLRYNAELEIELDDINSYEIERKKTPEDESDGEYEDDSDDSDNDTKDRSGNCFIS